MKTKNSLLIIALFASMLCYAEDNLLQNNLFNKLEHKDISQITITKTLLHLFPKNLVSADIKGMKLENFFTKTDQIDIFISQSIVSKKLMQKEIADFSKKQKSYEVLMKIKGDGENIVLYGRKSGEFIISMIMYIDDDDDEEECILIHLAGKFSLEDLKEMTEKKK